MAVAGDDGADLIFSEQFEIVAPHALGNVEIIIIGFIGLLQEEGVVHEDDEIWLVLVLGVSEGLVEPLPLFLIFVGGVFIVEDDITVEGDKTPGAEVEAVPVLVDFLAVPGNKFEGGGVADVVIAGDKIEFDLLVELAGDVKDGGQLNLIAGLVDDVAGEDDKLGAEAIGVGDGVLKKYDFLPEIGVGGDHAELGIGHLDEEIGLIIHFILFHSSNSTKVRSFWQ